MNFILLATGDGLHLGGNKALMDFKGQPWILYQLLQITRVELQNITIITNPELESHLEELVENFTPKVFILTNPLSENGFFSSVQLALAATPEGSCFLSPIESPLKGSTLKKLRQAWLQHGHLDALIPAYKNRQGYPLILSPDLQREILKMPPKDPASDLAMVLGRLPDNKKRIFAIEDPFIPLNLNTPEDLATLTS